MSAITTEPTLNFAVVGCGLIGRKRIAALAKVPGAAVRVACDLNAQRAADAARGVAGCAASTDFQAVVRDPSVEVVIVATLNGSLAPITLAAVQAGKHVLVEKPGALNAAELRTVAAAAAKTGALVRIGFNHRYHPALQKARALIDAGALGPLMFLRARYGHGGRKGYDREWRADPAQSGGGELIDQGVHLIDLAGWFLGDFTRVEGHAATYFWDMKVDDNAFLSLRTASGQTAWLHASCTEWKNLFSLEIYGRDAKLAIDGLGGSYGLERLAHYQMLPEMGPPETTIYEYPRGDDSWALELSEFVTDIRTRRVPHPGLPEGIRTLEIVEEIYRASGFTVAAAPATPLAE
ncbi:Gfo/Idh/MocA family oxidoreductase [Opitutus sp. ER46]|uniref:Gfo/Idh/MocA family protein n=1 Tax=Opitutus sp. ER46 TaxID=2161864 RepID=UPI000D320686|nr:Gfo/Idh/MocA family oxidoreductase [Opitutus sp. ER46]PTX92596.1 LmbZ [Opitutus sp. ER46]